MFGQSAAEVSGLSDIETLVLRGRRDECGEDVDARDSARDIRDHFAREGAWPYPRHYVLVLASCFNHRQAIASISCGVNSFARPLGRTSPDPTRPPENAEGIVGL